MTGREQIERSQKQARSGNNQQSQQQPKQKKTLFRIEIVTNETVLSGKRKFSALNLRLGFNYNLMIWLDTLGLISSGP